MAKEFAPCIGPVPSNSIYEACPFNMVLSLNTALLKPTLRCSRPDRLFYCLTLSPRCLHCDVTRIAIRSGGANFARDLSTAKSAKPVFQVLPTAKVVKPSCRSKNCRRTPWQGVGVYCDMHYNVIPFVCSLTNKRKTGLVMSRSLIERLDGPQTLVEMANRNFEPDTSELTEILSAILNPNPDGPKVYAVDTEFHQPRTGGALQISEVAYVDVKTGQIVVNAILTDDKRAVDASTKLASHKVNQKSSTFKDVPQIRTAVKMVKQLENCRFKANDKIVEWSMQRYCCLDLKNTHVVLKQNGYDSRRLLPNSSYALIKPVERFLGQVLKL